MLLLLLACDPVTLDGPDSSTQPIETSPPEQVPGTFALGKCSSIFDQDLLPEFALDFEPAEWAAVQADYQSGRKEYHPASFTYQEELIPVHVRLKGNPNFSWLGEKMQFVISFNEEDPDARFKGLRKLSLDASWYEETQLRDRLSWLLIREGTELPAACANNARLVVDGAYYGLYTNIEYFDREWVERNYGDEVAAEGVLWKYGSDAKTNESGASTYITNQFWQASTLSRFEELGSVDQWMDEWALEAVFGNDDGYWCCGHNFYLMEYQEQLSFVPWDLDDDLDVSPYDVDPVSGYGAGLFSQTAYRLVTEAYPDRYVDSVARMNEALDPERALPLIDAWQAQIDDSLLEDPHRSIGWEEHLQAVDRLRAYIPARHAYIDSWVACQRGSTEDADGDGYAVCEDPNDGDPSVNPAGTELCNGVDDDANGRVDDHPDCDDCIRRDFEERHLLYCDAPRTRTQAQAHCEQRGGTLWVPRTTPDIYMAYFWTWPPLEPSWWLGATDSATEGVWVDHDGQNTANTAYWASGEPNGGTAENCSAWGPRKVGWVSEVCEADRASICELP